MEAPCRYAILRFLPYAETGEFANVGVVLISTTKRFFGFRLLKRRIARVTHFFDLHEHRHLREGLTLMREELERIAQELKRFGMDRRLKNVDEPALEAFFTELTRPRETLFRFDAPRVILTDSPNATLDELFGRYVERDFATREYQETVLERGLRRLLSAHHLGDRFTPRTVGDEQFNVKFPFVTAGSERIRIIKPLHLTHAEPAKAIDHGLQWAGRIAQLRKRKLLAGEILVTVQRKQDKAPYEQAAQDVRAMLIEAGAMVVDYAADNQIIEFAQAS
ncbi:MAG: DUF3037 domain-containing protein [Rudaea sp.]|uniref:DUF3037 domain-containing protein n=1 Tax=Rudaea sp. TaxID=2136325 RepID=UPI0039E4904B